MSQRLKRAFFRRPVVRVARALLGQKLVRHLDGTELAGIIVETEAYLGVSDKAAHTCNGRRTQRNASMWGDGGHAYVYFTYGLHHCMNVVAGAVDEPVAVLIRALEPVAGLEQMRAHRQQQRGRRRAGPLAPTDLCSGPAKLTAALAIDRTLDGADLATGDDLFILELRRRAFRSALITATPRIGIGYAEEWIDRPLRFALRGNPHVSV